MEPLPDKLNTGKNPPALEYVAGLSAHSDMAAVLENAIAPLGAAVTFCPDPGPRCKALKSGGEAVDSIGSATRLKC